MLYVEIISGLWIGNVDTMYNKKFIEDNKKIFDRNFLHANGEYNTYQPRPTYKTCSNNKYKHSEFQINKSTNSKYLDIEKDSILKNLKKKENVDNNPENICKSECSKSLPNEVNDIFISNSSFPQIAIKNSYIQNDSPIVDCNRTICNSFKPFILCNDSKQVNETECYKKDWSKYSRINDLTNQMIKDTRYYTDNNTYPFVLNHIAVNKTQKCYDEYCMPLFNMNTSKNSIDGKCEYNKLKKKCNFIRKKN